MNRYRSLVKRMFPLSCAFLLCTTLVPANALAQAACQMRADDRLVLEMEEGEDEKHCNSVAIATSDRRSRNSGGASIITAFSAGGQGPFEGEIILQLKGARFAKDKNSEFEELNLEHYGEGELDIGLGLGSSEQTQWVGENTSTSWKFKFQLPVTLGNYQLVVRVKELKGKPWDQVVGFYEFDTTLRLRRITQGCWVDGNVRGTRVWGDNAFWSDNPTGLDGGIDNVQIMSAGEAQQQLNAIGNMDIDALLNNPALKEMLDPEQLRAAKAAAQNVQVQDSDTKEASASLADEFRQFEGHYFLTLQSVRSDDDVQLLGGPSAGIAGDLSLPDLVRGTAHILSKFSMTFELSGATNPNEPEPLPDVAKSLMVHRAGLVFEGLKYTWPADGGDPPFVRVYQCPGRIPDKVNGPMCGRVTWPEVAIVDFHAGPGAFSCINN